MIRPGRGGARADGGAQTLRGVAGFALPGLAELLVFTWLKA